MRPALVLLLALAACARPEPPAEVAAVSFRDRAVPIGSTVRGAPSDLAGEWVIAQAFPGVPFAAPGTRVLVGEATGGTALWRFEGPGGARDLALSAGMPGRYLASDLGPELWLLWVDDDFRTAVVGTPEGSFGWIMDRPGAASADRTVAAREVLEWSGYDLTRLGLGS